MLRQRKLPEFALGFFFAALFWVGIFGWIASYSPTEKERDECREAAKASGHKTEECKSLWERTTSDPVAFFTFWLSIFTLTLTGGTIALWWTTRSGIRTQISDTRILQRAYLSVDIEGINPYRQDVPRTEHVVVAHLGIRNAGNLPARNVRWSMQTTFSDVDNLEVATVSTVEQLWGDNVVPPETVMRQGTYAFILSGENTGWVYVWGRVIYDDGFKSGRTTHYCHRYPRRMLEKMEKDGYGIRPVYGRYHQNGNDAD